MQATIQKKEDALAIKKLDSKMPLKMYPNILEQIERFEFLYCQNRLISIVVEK